MTDSRIPATVPATPSRHHQNGAAARLVGLVALLYGFLVSIGMLGRAFKMFSGGFVGGLVAGVGRHGERRQCPARPGAVVRRPV